MEIDQLMSVLESLITVSAEPLTKNAMALLLEPDQVTKADIDKALEGIIKKHSEDLSSGLCLTEVAGGYHFRTKPCNAPFIARLDVPKPSKLSQASLETLAIIAYKQPIVRSEIEEIRGVDSGGVLKNLLERNLIKIIGKRDEPGNPLIYATASRFLELFNLNSLKELPTLREYEDLEKEHYKGAIKEEEEKPIFEDIQNVAAPFEQKWSQEDEGMLGELTEGIKKLRKLERDIFPKPVEQIVAVPNVDAIMQEAEGVITQQGEDIATGTVTEDTGSDH